MADDRRHSAVTPVADPQGLQPRVRHISAHQASNDPPSTPRALHAADRALTASKVRLVDVLADVGVRSLKYLYDFGDGWEHSVRIERVTDVVPGIVYPRLTEAARRCPPEDVGGPWGYREFLEAIADPDHEEHAERLEWVGAPFDPADADVESLAQAVNRLAKTWARKPTASRKRTN